MISLDHPHKQGRHECHYPRKENLLFGNLNTIYHGETLLSDVTVSVKQLKQPVNITNIICKNSFKILKV